MKVMKKNAAMKAMQLVKRIAIKATKVMKKNAAMKAIKVMKKKLRLSKRVEKRFQNHSLFSFSNPRHAGTTSRR